tara:strand:- start:44 stop:772 length:729 start_codon:yes stop_codon:yes gene_type:complete
MAHSKSEIRKAKNLLNKYAPKGEQLAFINAKEVNLLKRKGGSGKMTKAGIRSYTEDEEDTGDVSNAGSSSSSSGGGGDNDNSPQPASFRSVAPKTAAPRSMLSKIGGAIKTAAATALTAATFGVGTIAAMGINKTAQYVTKNIGGTMTRTSYNPDNVQNRTAQVNMGGGDSGNNMSASNVGGKIVKLAPTSAEVSQSKATDVTYDSRKTKARGRSMTILTNSRGVGKNMSSVLGKKSLLGAV